VQVDPIKPLLKAPGTKHLTLKHDEPLLFFDFKFNLRRYIKGNAMDSSAAASVLLSYCTIRAKVGQCRLTLRNPRSKRLQLSAISEKLLSNLAKFCFQTQPAPLHHGAGSGHRVHLHCAG